MGSQSKRFKLKEGFRPMMTDQMKYALIRRQLCLYLHAYRCQVLENQNNQAIPRRQCYLPHCRTTKNVLNHMYACRAGKNCTMMDCKSARQIIGHYKHCTVRECPVCMPVKQLGRNVPTILTLIRGGRTGRIKLMNMLNNSSYSEAQSRLGQNNNIITNPGRSTIIKIGNQNVIIRKRDSNNMPVKHKISRETVKQAIDNALANQRNNNNNNNITTKQPGDNGITMKQPSYKQYSIKKEWHKTVTPLIRNQNIDKLIRTICPVDNPETIPSLNSSMPKIVAYAQKVEAHMYEIAISKRDYCNLITKQIFKYQKKRMEVMNKKHKVQQPKAANTVTKQKRFRLTKKRNQTRKPDETNKDEADVIVVGEFNANQNMNQNESSTVDENEVAALKARISVLEGNMGKLVEENAKMRSLVENMQNVFENFKNQWGDKVGIPAIKVKDEPQ